MMKFVSKNIMDNNFQIEALPAEEFIAISKLSDEALTNIGAKRMTVDKFGKFPCRVSLEDAQVGEDVILLCYEHHKTSSPYRASGPVFIRPHTASAMLASNEIPQFLAHRYLSLRAYNKEGIMKEAFTTDGKELHIVLTKSLTTQRQITSIFIMRDTVVISVKPEGYKYLQSELKFRHFFGFISST
jgi:hypothetical protein